MRGDSSRNLPVKTAQANRNQTKICAKTTEGGDKKTIEQLCIERNDFGLAGPFKDPSKPPSTNEGGQWGGRHWVTRGSGKGFRGEGKA